MEGGLCHSTSPCHPLATCSSVLASPEQTSQASWRRAARRLIARLGLGLFEHWISRVAEHVIKLTACRTASAAGTHFAGRVTEEVVEKATSHFASGHLRRRMLETSEHQLAKKTGAQLKKGAMVGVERVGHGAIAKGVEDSIEWVSPIDLVVMLTALVSAVGAVMTFLMVCTDWKRFKQERKQGYSLSSQMFLAAAFFDFCDFVQHFAGFICILFFRDNEEYVHSFETISTVCAVLATVAMIIGEMTSNVHVAKPPAAGKVAVVVSTGSKRTRMLEELPSLMTRSRQAKPI